MGITAVSGPTLAYGVTLSSSGAVSEYNEQRGPSMADLGEALLDPRPQFTYQPGFGTTTTSSIPTGRVFGWAGLFGGPVVDQVPTTISASGVATSFSAAGASGTVTISTAGGTNLTQVTNFLGSTLTTAVTVFAIDTPMAGAAFGSAGTVNIWDPTKAISRALSITSSVNNSASSYTITGYDLYGFRMTCAITGPNATTVVTPKAFKYVQSITWTGAGTSTGVSVGVADTYGFPLRVDAPAYATVWWGTPAASFILNSTGLHAFAALVTPTASTGDVRGTVNVSTTASSTSTGVRLMMNISPSVQNLQSIGSTTVYTTSAGVLASTAVGGLNGVLNFAGLVGVPQF